MEIVFITGATGSGKSTLIAAAQRHSRIALFDCKAPGGASWAAPDADDCDAVAVDHVHHRGPSTVVADAMAWCTEHGRPLILAELWRSDMDYLVIEPEYVAELNLNNAPPVLLPALADLPVEYWWLAIRQRCDSDTQCMNTVSIVRRLGVQQRSAP